MFYKYINVPSTDGLAAIWSNRIGAIIKFHRRERRESFLFAIDPPKIPADRKDGK